MSEDPLPTPPSVRTSIGTLLHRLIWRREVGPVVAEGRIEVSELITDSGPAPKPETDDPPA